MEDILNNDMYYDNILKLITEKGELGVNVIANELKVPLSTMQRYLSRQTYFRKTINRKWDLPDNVDSDIKSNTMTLMVNSVENALMLLDSQLAEIRSSVQNALMPVSTLKRAVDNISTPVADKTVNIDPQMLNADKKIKDMYVVFKKYVSQCPEEYQELLANVDLHRLTLELGNKFMNGDFNVAISGLFLKQETVLSDFIIDVLSEYQKE